MGRQLGDTACVLASGPRFPPLGVSNMIRPLSAQEQTFPKQEREELRFTAGAAL